MSTFSFSYVARNLHHRSLPAQRKQKPAQATTQPTFTPKTIKNITVRFVGVEENIGGP